MNPHAGSHSRIGERTQLRSVPILAKPRERDLAARSVRIQNGQSGATRRTRRKASVARDG